MRTDHKQKRVRANGWSANVDKGLAPLIKELWKAGIYTTNSCEDNRPGGIYQGPYPDYEVMTGSERWPDGCVWIGMPADCALKFMKIIVDFEGDQNFYLRLFEGEWVGIHFTKMWEFKVSMFDWSYVIDDDGHSLDGPSELEFMISMRFPKEDLEKVYAKVKEHNETK
jgi:hypothetical protein